MFSISGHTAIESAGMANIYEAFTYLSCKNAEAKYQQRLIEVGQDG